MNINLNLTKGMNLIEDYKFDTLIPSNQFLIVPTTFLSVPSSNGEVNPANSTSSENGLLPPALHNL